MMRKAALPATHKRNAKQNAFPLKRRECSEKRKRDEEKGIAREEESTPIKRKECKKNFSKTPKIF